MTYDLAAAKTKAANKAQDDLDYAAGEVSNNFDAKLVELIEKNGLTPSQKAQFLLQLDSNLLGFMNALLAGQGVSLPQPGALAGGSTPAATTAGAPDPKLQQERDDLVKKVDAQNTVIADLASHFKLARNTDGSPKPNFAKDLIAEHDKQIKDAKAAPADSVLKSDVKPWGEGINHLLARATPGNRLQGKENMILNQETFDNLKSHADEIVKLGS